MTVDERIAAEAAVRAAVLDYFEGWFDGDATRMERALHPALAKRKVLEDGWSLDESTTEQMIDATARGVGRTRGSGDRQMEVEVVDIYRTIANVTVRSEPYREYVQLAQTRDGWKIINTLWDWT